MRLYACEIYEHYIPAAVEMMTMGERRYRKKNFKSSSLPPPNTHVFTFIRRLKKLKKLTQRGKYHKDTNT
jgi:hypothetical protein